MSMNYDLLYGMLIQYDILDYTKLCSPIESNEKTVEFQGY